MRDLQLGPRATVVDVGCGEGRHSVALAERFGVSVHGVDPVARHLELSNARLAAAAARRPELGQLVRFARGSAESLPLEDRIADVVWCRDVLVHVAALQTAFGEWRRVMRDGGRAIVFHTVATSRLEPREATLEYFLFRRRAGHCEYFSTALAILLRDAASGMLRKAWVLVMVLAFSLRVVTRIVFDQKIETYPVYHWSTVRGQAASDRPAAAAPRSPDAKAPGR